MLAGVTVIALVAAATAAAARLTLDPGTLDVYERSFVAPAEFVAVVDLQPDPFGVPGGGGGPPGGGGGSKPAPPGKTTICHHTGSSTNPWVEITVADESLPAHVAHGDIVPAPPEGCPRGFDFPRELNGYVTLPAPYEAADVAPGSVFLCAGAAPCDANDIPALRRETTGLRTFTVVFSGAAVVAAAGGGPLPRAETFTVCGVISSPPAHFCATDTLTLGL